MAFKQKRLIVVLGFGLSLISLHGQQVLPVAPLSGSNSSKIFRGKVIGLQHHEFYVGNLKISIQLDRPLIGGGGEFTLRVDNLSNEFIFFNPWDFLVVNFRGYQIQFKEVGISNQGQTTSFIPSNIAPEAYISRIYAIPETENLKPKFKIYFGNKLLAEVSD